MVFTIVSVKSSVLQGAQSRMIIRNSRVQVAQMELPGKVGSFSCTEAPGVFQQGPLSFIPCSDLNAKGLPQASVLGLWLVALFGDTVELLEQCLVNGSGLLRVDLESGYRIRIGLSSLLHDPPRCEGTM